MLCCYIVYLYTRQRSVSKNETVELLSQKITQEAFKIAKALKLFNNTAQGDITDNVCVLSS